MPSADPAEAHVSEHGAETVTVNEPRSGWPGPGLRELWQNRELLYFLTWRDVKVRYKQTALGAAWAILQPVFTMLIFTVVFGRLAKLDSDNVPYPVFAFTALVPWTFFANAITQAAASLTQNERMITKVYFPRLVLPISAVLGALVDFLLAFVVLVVMMGFYGIVPTAWVLALPLFLLLATTTAFAVGFFLAAVNVRYRDVRYVIPFLVQAWLFITPVAYSISLVPREWRFLYGLNPMVGAIEGFRWALIGKAEAPGLALTASVLAALVLLGGGLLTFRRMEDTFSDEV